MQLNTLYVTIQLVVINHTAQWGYIDTNYDFVLSSRMLSYAVC